MGKTKITKQRPEDIVQQQVIAYLSAVATRLKIAFYAVLNESAMKGGDNKTKHRLVQWLKRMGMVPGAGDITLHYSGGRAAILEIKSATGRQSESQIDFARWIKRTDTPYYIIRSIKELETVLRILGISK